MNKISLVINTLNEEKNIADCINSAKDFVDEVIVCDMYSEDKTIEISKQLGATIIFHEKTGYVEPARRFAISHAKYEWILVLDADERLTKDLACQLINISQREDIDVVSFSSLFLYFGGYVKNGVFFSNNWHRFFRKQTYISSYSESENIVHFNFSNLTKSRKKIVLPKKYYIIHEAYPTIEKYVVKTIDYYARIEASGKFEDGIRFSLFKMLSDPIKIFLYSYFFKGGFRDGIRGLILHVLFSIYRFNFWANLWFLETNKKNG